MNMLRRLPLSRLLLLCGLVVGIGASITALAFALGTGAKPPAKPLPQAVHDALVGAQGGSVQGVSANITLSNHLLEGANLAAGSGAGGGLASSPLLTGGSGRLWVAKDGRMRIELQAQKGDTQIVYDGHTVTIYDAANNTVYRYTPKNEGGGSPAKPETGTGTQTPSVAEIEKKIADIRKHANLSDATPTNVAGQPAYTVRIAPNEGGSLLGGAELSFDANNGAPLRAAVYSSTNSSPVIELAATEVSFGAVPDSIFQITPPAGAKVEELALHPSSGTQAHDKTGQAKDAPKVTSHGHGISSVGVLEAHGNGSKTGSALEGLPKVKINGLTASELRTELGTILTFERAGVRYVVAGAVAPAAVEAIARGL